ncbi:unnamed protein product [Cylindrotheca closterium]|nr:unnamed protein product [Cylindrotheca closterium]
MHETIKTLAGVAGNVLEWYDFAVFGYFSDILGKVFFPPHQAENVALMEAFAVFGGAFVMRPLGGILMGHLGDLYGSKTALQGSIFLMAVPTFAMGCLPTYAQVGAWSYTLLILVRLLQGLSVGGQLMSSLVFTLEGKPKKHWGLYGSYVMATANFGTLLGGLVGYLIRSNLTEEQLLQYGWRIPFLSGILVSVCGLYLKFYCDGDDEDDATFHHHAATTKRTSPLRLALRPESRRQLLAACLVPMLYSGGFYLCFVWMAIFMADLIPSDPFTTQQAFGINSLSLFVSVCLLFPVAGILSDWYGRRTIMTIGGILSGLGAPFLIMGIAQGYPTMTFASQSILGVSLSFWGAPMMAWLVESFPPENRLTSAAVGYNIGQACVGGVTPALATFLVDRYDDGGGYYLFSTGGVTGFLITALAMISLLGLWVISPQPSLVQLMPLLLPVKNNVDCLKEENSRLLQSMETAETLDSCSSAWPNH